MTNIYPQDFVHAKECYNCYSLFDHFCVKRNTQPTEASIFRFGCDCYFSPINSDGEHNCLNCVFHRKDWCVTHHKVVENDKNVCQEFRVRPYFKQSPVGLTMVRPHKESLHSTNTGVKK